MGTMTTTAEKIKQSILTIVGDVGKDLPLSSNSEHLKPSSKINMLAID